jgi:hypothetical protein
LETEPEKSFKNSFSKSGSLEEDCCPGETGAPAKQAKRENSRSRREPKRLGYRFISEA